MTSETSPAPGTILEQYKSYLGDIGNIGTRYATSNGFYLSVITALLGILALTKAGEVFASPKAALGLAVPTFAILVCMVWSRSIASYQKLFAVKFKVLREMESAGNLFLIFKREDELRGKLTILENERLIPLLLSIPFWVTLIYLLCKLFKVG